MKAGFVCVTVFLPDIVAGADCVSVQVFGEEFFEVGEDDEVGVEVDDAGILFEEGGGEEAEVGGEGEVGGDVEAFAAECVHCVVDVDEVQCCVRVFFEPVMGGVDEILFDVGGEDVYFAMG